MSTQYYYLIIIYPTQASCLLCWAQRTLSSYVSLRGTSSSLFFLSVSLCQPQGHRVASRHPEPTRGTTWHFPEHGPWARPPAPLSPLLKVVATHKPPTWQCSVHGKAPHGWERATSRFPPRSAQRGHLSPGSWSQQLRSQTHRKRPREFGWVWSFFFFFFGYYSIALFLKEIKAWAV